MTDTIKVWECKAEVKWGLTTDPDYDEMNLTRKDAEDYAMERLYEDLSDLFLRGDYDDFKGYFNVRANCVDEVAADSV